MVLRQKRDLKASPFMHALVLSQMHIKHLLCALGVIQVNKTDKNPFLQGTHIEERQVMHLTVRESLEWVRSKWYVPWDEMEQRSGNREFRRPGGGGGK